MPGLKLGKEAQAKFEEAKANPDKAGILEKKGAKRKNWKDRWFVMKDNYLFYCKTEKSNPQGIINLHACTVSKIEGPTARPNAFSLLAPKSVSIDAKWTNRTYLFAAKSAKELQSWMDKMEESGKKAAERAMARKAELQSSSSSASLGKAAAESDSSSSDDERPAAKPVEKKEEIKKVEVKKEEVKKEEVKKEEVKKQAKDDSEDEGSGHKELVDADKERDLPSSPRVKKEKKEKKEKKHKKEKKDKKEKKEKETHKEEPIEAPKKEDAPKKEEVPKKEDPPKIEEPHHESESDSDSEPDYLMKSSASSTHEEKARFQLADSDASEDEAPSKKHDSDEDSD